MKGWLYNFILILESLFALSLASYLALLIFSSIMGAPYVPTKRKLIKDILKKARLKRGQKLLELGSGDGRVSLIAAKDFGARVVGIDINPWVINKARLLAFIKGLRAKFHITNILSFNLSNYDVIYIFLMPELTEKLGKKLAAEIKNGTIVISHGFKIKSLAKYLVYTLPNETSFWTYYYKLGSMKV